MFDFFTDDLHHQTLTEQHNLDGSTDLTDTGVVVDHQPGSMVEFHNGQEVIHDPYNNVTFANGKEVAHTQANELGGHDVYHDGQLAYRTMPNAEGGENIMDPHMNELGFSVENGVGGLDYIALQGNSHEILDYADPLEHVHEYRMDPLVLK